MKGLLESKVALITGGARGMGAAESRLFAEQGARVFIADVLDDEGYALADSIGPQATYMHLDVTDESSWGMVVETIKDQCGKLDILVNNAGIMRVNTLEDTSLEEYMSVINVNQVGTFLGMRSVIPLMKQGGGGAIVNIASADGMVGSNGLSSYAASKWAVRGMTKVAARELGQDGIRVNSVNPGGIVTPLTGGKDGGLAHMPHDSRKQVPLYRAGEPEEVAQTVLFLSSELSSYTTGGDFLVDGGLINCQLYEAFPGAPVDPDCADS